MLDGFIFMTMVLNELMTLLVCIVKVLWSRRVKMCDKRVNNGVS